MQVLKNLLRSDWDKNETMSNSNCRCDMQTHASVCEENITGLEKNDTYWNNFVIKGVSLKDYIGRVGDISRWYSQEWFTIT